MGESGAFAARYGPWAVVVGASDGVGLAFSHAMAERGVNVVLLSRRQAVLDTAAADISARWGVETRALAVDLNEPDATDRIVAGTADLEIGMLLMQDSQMLLVDEPVAGMTPQEVERTAELLLSLEGQHSVVVVEHDMNFVRSIARRVTVLHEGHVLAEGTMDQVQNDAKVVEVYLGE